MRSSLLSMQIFSLSALFSSFAHAEISPCKKLYQRIKNAPKSEKESLLKQGVESCPESLFALHLWVFYQDKKQLKEALEAYRLFLQRFAQNPGSPDEAQRVCQFIIEKGPPSGEPLPAACASEAPKEKSPPSPPPPTPVQPEPNERPDSVELTLSTDLPGTLVRGLPGDQDGLVIEERTIVRVPPGTYMIKGYIPQMPVIEKLVSLKRNNENNVFNFIWQTHYEQRYGAPWSEYRSSPYLPKDYSYKGLATAGRIAGFTLALFGVVWMSIGATNLNEPPKTALFASGLTATILGVPLIFVSLHYPRERPRTYAGFLPILEKHNF